MMPISNSKIVQRPVPLKEEPACTAISKTPSPVPLLQLLSVGATNSRITSLSGEVDSLQPSILNSLCNEEEAPRTLSPTEEGDSEDSCLGDNLDDPITKKRKKVEKLVTTLKKRKTEAMNDKELPFVTTKNEKVSCHLCGRTFVNQRVLDYHAIYCTGGKLKNSRDSMDSLFNGVSKENDKIPGPVIENISEDGDEEVSEICNDCNSEAQDSSKESIVLHPIDETPSTSELPRTDSSNSSSKLQRCASRKKTTSPGIQSKKKKPPFDRWVTAVSVNVTEEKSVKASIDGEMKGGHQILAQRSGPPLCSLTLPPPPLPPLLSSAPRPPPLLPSLSSAPPQPPPPPPQISGSIPVKSFHNKSTAQHLAATNESSVQNIKTVLKFSPHDDKKTTSPGIQSKSKKLPLDKWLTSVSVHVEKEKPVKKNAQRSGPLCSLTLPPLPPSLSSALRPSPLPPSLSSAPPTPSLSSAPSPLHPSLSSAPPQMLGSIPMKFRNKSLTAQHLAATNVSSVQNIKTANKSSPHKDKTGRNIGMTKDCQYKSMGWEEDKNMDVIDGFSFFSYSSMEKLENDKSVSIDEIYGIKFISCSSMEKLQVPEPEARIPLPGDMLGIKGQPCSDDMDIDNNGSGDIPAPRVPESLPVCSNEPAPAKIFTPPLNVKTELDEMLEKPQHQQNNQQPRQVVPQVIPQQQVPVQLSPQQQPQTPIAPQNVSTSDIASNIVEDLIIFSSNQQPSYQQNKQPIALAAIDSQQQQQLPQQSKKIPVESINQDPGKHVIADYDNIHKDEAGETVDKNKQQDAKVSGRDLEDDKGYEGINREKMDIICENETHCGEKEEMLFKNKIKNKPKLVKCDHDSVIDANIAEKEAMFEKLGFPALKRKLVQDAQESKKRKGGGARKKTPVDCESTRKSSRVIKKVDYTYPGWDSSFRAEPAKRPTRPKKQVNYNYETHPDDAYVHCDTCGENKLYGCELHPPIFDYIPKLDICSSRAGKDSGRGVFNLDKNGIPKGVMFGPYKGEVYSTNQYKLLTEEKGESGYAWELKDPETGEVIGFVDPGPNPNPENDWMSMVNCATKEFHENAVAFQYLGSMYYRTVRVIKEGEEFLVYYGDLYAKELRIDVTKRNLYERAEYWEEKGAVCPYCGDGFSTEEYLEAHIEGGDGVVVGCGVTKVDKNMEEVDKGIKPYTCNVCGVGFKWEFECKRHEANHKQNNKPLSCNQCEKTFASQNGLTRHKRTIHDGILAGSCPKCEKIFISASSMKAHIKTNCYQNKAYKCSQCGFKFAQKNNLEAHIRVLHNRQFLFKCQFCDKRCGHKSDLKKHISTQHLKEDRQYECDVCERTFKSKWGLNNHRKIAHIMDWSYLCYFCMDLDIEKGFVNYTDLEVHGRTKHPVEYEEDYRRVNPFPCPKCTKRFPNKAHVKVHMGKRHCDD